MNCNFVPIKHGKDKVCHIIAGFIISFVAALILSKFIPMYYVGLASLAIGILAGVVKEAIDQYRYKGADYFDFFATLMGAAAGTVAFLVFFR